MSIISTIARTLRDTERQALVPALTGVLLSADAAALAEFYHFTVNTLIGYSTGDRRLVMEGARLAAIEVREHSYTLKVDGRAWTRDMERYFWITRIDCACYIPDAWDSEVARDFVEKMDMAEEFLRAREGRAEMAAQGAA